MQNFSKLFIVANFEMNRDIIAQTLCVKKAEPENCCKGSCHLKKQLDSDEKKQEAPGRTKRNSEEVQFCQIFQTISFIQPVQAETSNENGLYLEHFPEEPSSSIFHPPLV